MLHNDRIWRKCVMVRNFMNRPNVPESHAKSQRYKGFKIFLSDFAALRELCLCNIALTITEFGGNE